MHDDVSQTLKAMNERLASIESNTHSPKEFQSEVRAALLAIEEEELQQAMQAKYAKYTSAVEHVANDKTLYGNPSARFTLVEFSDLECPFCKQFHDTPKGIVDGSKGIVNWQWKHLPLGFHNPAAMKEALAAECVKELKGNRAFWVFVDDVFKYSRGNGKGVDDLAGLAQGVGVEPGQFIDCMASERHAATVKADMAQAQKNGINGTPATFVVDNQTGQTQLLTGKQPSQAFIATIRKMAVEAKTAATQ